MELYYNGIIIKNEQNQDQWTSIDKILLFISKNQFNVIKKSKMLRYAWKQLKDIHELNSLIKKVVVWINRNA